MRNHDEKIKDMVESILPSKRRKGARFERARAHRGERARLRVSLLRITRLVDPDDFGDDLGYEDKEAIIRLVESRREADKVAPLERWAERLVDTDPALEAMDYDERLAYFAALLPDNTVGRHALSHLKWVIGTPPEWQFHWITRRPRTHKGPDQVLLAVEAILAVGGEGELNLRIKHEVADHTLSKRFTPSGSVRERVERPRRLLAGQHERDDFVAAVRGRDEAQVVLALAREINR